MPFSDYIQVGLHLEDHTAVSQTRKTMGSQDYGRAFLPELEREVAETRLKISLRLVTQGFKSRIFFFLTLC